MPNLYLTSNNVFKGRSFDEWLRPLAMYTDVYNKIEADLGELETKAGVWENMANEQTDPIAYARYKRYADDLRRQAQILATSKLNPSTTRNILDLKRRYASEIVPIEQAYANRKAQADEQRKALLQNPTLLLSRRADATSLDDYLENSQLGYESYSGALLADQVGTAAEAIAKQLRGAIETGKLDDYTNVWMQRHGVTSDEVLLALTDPHNPKSSRVLTAIVDDAVNSSGIPKWGDMNITKQAYNYAGQGLWKAVGQTNVSTFENKGAIMAAEEAKAMRLIREREKSQRRLMRERAALAASQNGQGGVDGPLLNPRPLRTANEMKDSALINETVKTYIGRGLLKKVGDGYELTREGKQEYLRLLKKRQDSRNNRSKLAPVTGSIDFNRISQINDSYHDFSQFVEEMYNKALGRKSKDRIDFSHNRDGVLAYTTKQVNERLSKAIGSYDDEHYDLTRETGWVQQLDDSDSKYLRKLALSRPEGSMKKLTFNGSGWDEKEVKTSEFKGYIPIERETSLYGTRLTWYNDKTMDSFQTNEPSGINYRMSEKTHALAIEGHKYQQILQEGKLPQYDKEGNIVTDDRGRIQFTNTPLTKEQIMALNDNYLKVLFEADYSGHSIVSPGKTKSREYNTHEPSMLYGNTGPDTTFDFDEDLEEDFEDFY